MNSLFTNRFSWKSKENEDFRQLYFGCAASDFIKNPEEQNKDDLELQNAYAADTAELEICMWLDHIKHSLMLRHIENNEINRTALGIMSRTNISYKRIDYKNGTGVKFDFPNELFPKTFLSIVEAADWLQSEVHEGLKNW